MTLQWKSRWPVSALIAGVLLSLSGTGVEAASAVITGEGGWLFPAWESLSKVDNPGTTRNIALVKQLQQNLAREHISLVVLVVPMKAPFYASRLPASQPLSPAVMQRYELLQSELTQAGLTTLNIKPVLQRTEHGKQTAFYRADYHWTAWSAENTADATAQLITERYRLQANPAVARRWASGSTDARSAIWRAISCRRSNVNRLVATSTPFAIRPRTTC
ncbi:hypothetical protein [Pseudomonas sp. B14-6]|jgi:alginate O-acetyltransferase complex protein AlgJ|uniref:alginate O-acetyltransferase AlgX-related protein n=1 Tax=Pseudomonas sp. B14-6 TaxID=2738843 RepID=UPI002114D48B|nr:hypothetical protein [Pseudomonas sp. B14-6]